MVMAALAALGLGARFVPAALRGVGLASRAGQASGRLITGGAIRGGRFAMSGRGQLALTAGAIGGSFALSGGGGGQPGPAGATAGIAYSWNTGTAEFHRLTNGKIGTVKRNGVWKEWRPYRPVVIPKRWNSRSMGRVRNALKRNQKVAIDIVKMSGGDASATKRAKTKYMKPNKGGVEIINVD